jgi:hypothetical protein
MEPGALLILSVIGYRVVFLAFSPATLNVTEIQRVQAGLQGEGFRYERYSHVTIGYHCSAVGINMQEQNAKFPGQSQERFKVRALHVGDTMRVPPPSKILPSTAEQL